MEQGGELNRWHFCSPLLLPTSSAPPSPVATGIQAHTPGKSPPNQHKRSFDARARKVKKWQHFEYYLQMRTVSMHTGDYDTLSRRSDEQQTRWVA